jgi:hypothetical protein
LVNWHAFRAPRPAGANKKPRPKPGLFDPPQDSFSSMIYSEKRQALFPVMLSQ